MFDWFNDLELGWQILIALGIFLAIFWHVAYKIIKQILGE